MITFTKNCVAKFLHSRKLGHKDRDLWNLDNQENMWNNFMQNYTTLCLDKNAVFCHEYTYKLEVSFPIMKTNHVTYDWV